MTTSVVFPLRSGQLLALLVGTLLLTLAHAAGKLGWPYADWASTSAESRQSLTLAGPWATACAAWAAAQISATRGAVAPLTGARMGAGLVLPLGARLCGVALAGWALGLTPLMTRDALRATAGSPDVLVIAASAAMLVALTTAGLLLGVCLPLRGAVLAALVGSVSVVLAADALGPVTAVTWSTGVVAGQQEVAGVAATRLAVALVAAVCCTVAAALWLEHRTVPASPRTAGPLLIVALPLLFVPASLDASAPIVAEPDPPETCRALSGDGVGHPIELCVHSARAAVLDEAGSAAQRTVDAAGPLARSVTQVRDVNLGERAHGSTLVVQLHPYDSGWRGHLVEDLSFQLSGAAACADRVGDDGMVEDLSGADTSAGVAIWLADRAGGDGSSIAGSPGALGVADRLAEMDDAEVTVVLDAAAPALATCSADGFTAP